MFDFFGSFIKTIFYIIGFALLISSILPGKWSDPEKEEPRLSVDSSGDCLLPGLSGEANWYEHNGDKWCSIHAIEKSYHLQTPRPLGDNINCILINYSIAGWTDEKNFIVGRRWLVFPRRQRETVCVVLLSEKNWNIASLARPSDYQPVVLKGDNFRDASWADILARQRDLNFDIAYSGEVVDSKSIINFLEKAKTDVLQLEKAYKLGGLNKININVYGHRRLFGSISHPLCTLEGVVPVDVNPSRIFSIVCNEDRIKFWTRRGEVVHGLKPGERQEVYSSIANRLVDTSGPNFSRSRGDFTDRQITAYSELGIRYQDGIPPSKKRAIPDGVSAQQLSYILKEGAVLGWWIESGEILRAQRAKARSATAELEKR